MKPPLRLLAVLCLAAAGCTSPWEPASGPIHGKVTYLSGAPAQAALVGVVNGDETFTSYDGSFWLSVPKGLDTLTVYAREVGSHAETYAATLSGFIRLPAHRGAIPVRVVLDHSDPI